MYCAMKGDADMRRLMLMTLVLSFASFLDKPTAAQSAWPTKDVRIVAPFPAGSPADQIARMIAEPLKQLWGKTVVIDNIPGAAGSVGVTKVTKAAPDG